MQVTRLRSSSYGVARQKPAMIRRRARRRRKNGKVGKTEKRGR